MSCLAHITSQFQGTTRSRGILISCHATSIPQQRRDFPQRRLPRILRLEYDAHHRCLVQQSACNLRTQPLPGRSRVGTKVSLCSQKQGDRLMLDSIDGPRRRGPSIGQRNDRVLSPSKLQRCPQRHIAVSYDDILEASAVIAAPRMRWFFPQWCTGRQLAIRRHQRIALIARLLQSSLPNEVL